MKNTLKRVVKIIILAIILALALLFGIRYIVQIHNSDRPDDVDYSCVDDTPLTNCNVIN